jgi:hypothetical protein
MKNLLSMLFISTLLISCGARKVNKSKEDVKIDITTTQKDSISIKTLTKTNSVYKEVDEEVTYEPIDPTLEMIVKGEVFKNTKIKTSKSTKDNQVSRTIDSSLESLSDGQSDVKVISVKKDKVVVRDTVFNYPWMWILIIILAIGYYLYFTRKP